uniref:NIDO domain-containing protein n=1 Tax=Astyanax mexicanus TaxID=7994 RepID=A0A3B1ITQ1_ASTMX
MTLVYFYFSNCHFYFFQAGYQTREDNNYFISVPNISDLSASTNVGIPGRWAFQVDGPSYVPTTLFPVLSSAIRPPFYDGGNTQVQLSHPFTYFGKEYTSLFFNMDGVIMFESVWLDDYIPNLHVDAIAPLWSDIDTYTRGVIKYEQATDGPLLRQASHEINRAFPGSNFNASWVFVGTWLKVEFEPDTGEVTFQVVLIADDEGHSFVLMNYGPLPADQQPWMAGYQTKDNTHQYIIQTASTSDLTTSTNVGIPGRWAFSVNDPFQLFFPIPPSAVHHAVTSDGYYAEIQLDHKFSYFGKDHEKLYVSKRTQQKYR